MTVVKDVRRPPPPARPVARPGAAVVVLMLTAACYCSPFSGGKMEVVAYFEDSAGLFVGNDVGILGVTVGKITSIEPEGDEVKVTMEVDDDYDVPADAGAVVVARSVATDRYVELTPVYPRARRWRTATRSGWSAPGARSTSTRCWPRSTSSRPGSLAPRRRRTRSPVHQPGTAALKGNGPLINQTVHALQEGVNGIHGQRDNIASTLRSLDVLLAAVSTNEATARSSSARSTEAADLLADERNNFRRRCARSTTR